MAMGLDPLEPTDLDHRLEVAEAVVREAGRAAAGHFARRELLSVIRKGAQNLVSEADRLCEDLIVAGLSRMFTSETRNSDALSEIAVDAATGDDVGFVPKRHSNAFQARLWIEETIVGEIERQRDWLSLRASGNCTVEIRFFHQRLLRGKPRLH